MPQFPAFSVQRTDTYADTDPAARGGTALEHGHANDACARAEEAPLESFARLATGLTPGTVIAGRYRVLSQLGCGAQGEVFSVEHLELHKLFALKLLRPSSPGQPANFERLATEARLLAKLRHPHIVDVSDLGKTPTGRTFMVMEHLQGMTLGELLALRGPLPWPWLREAALQVLDALGTAHAAGVIHRDVKPGNLFVTGTGADLLRGRASVKLLDLGIARVFEQGSSVVATTGALLGTPLYMSPEQLLGEALTPATDLYSFAVSLYELVSGAPPFFGRTAIEIASQHVTQQAPRLLDANPRLEVPRGLEELLSRALHKSPNARFENANALAEALARLDCQSGTTRQPSPVGSVATHAPPTPTVERDFQQSALARLAHHVRTSWVDRALARALEPLGELPVRRVVDFARVVGVMAEERSSCSREPTAKQTLLSLFEEHGYSMLLLGPAGSGKTLQLLLLCKGLLERHARSPSDPLPVVVDLSCWDDHDGPLKEYILCQLASKYQTPAKLARQWLEDGRLLPLLDGLDEVPIGRREACAAAINRFLLQQGGPGIVVACRDVAYQELGVPLMLRCAVVLRNLYDRDVDACLQRLDRDGVDPRIQAIRTDTFLWEAVHSPLLLRLLAQNPQSCAAPLKGAKSGILDALYQSYLETLLDVRPWDQRRARSLVHRVALLATAMVRLGRRSFLVEELQPCWLRTSWTRVTFVVLTRLALSALFSALFIVPFGRSPLDNLGFKTSLVFASQLALKSALTLAVYYSVRDLIRTLRPIRAQSSAWSSRLRQGSEALALGLLNAEWVRWGGHLTSGVMGFEVAFAGVLLLGTHWDASPMTRAVQPLEALRWSSDSLRANRATCLGIALLPALAVGALNGPWIGVFAFLTVAALAMLVVALRSRRIDDCVPGRSLRRTLRYSVLVGAAVAGTTSLSFVFFGGVSYGMSVGLALGGSTALWFGGISLVHHALLRGLLVFERTLPPRLEAVLGQAESLGLVHSVGSGYMFMHHSFAEFLAQFRPSQASPPRGPELTPGQP